MTASSFLKVLGLLSFLWITGAEAVELTTITPKGHVTFTAPDEWVVIGSPTKLPAASFVFQIPDPADEGTPHSTNVSVSLYDLTTSDGQKAFKVVGKRYGNAVPKTFQMGEWKILEQSVDQHGTSYIVLVAQRAVADVTVAICLAWPQMARHPGDFDSKMRELLQKLLASVRGEIGPFQHREGEVLHRR